MPKVIDFGVAKAAQGRLTDLTLFTQFEQMIGTPLYMSPEQAEMTSLDIDTRSDIYSLGVLLYELLTGSTPIDTATLRRTGLDEIRRIIREVDPPKPWVPLSETNTEQTTVFRGVGEANWEQVLIEIEARARLLEGVVFVHSHDVLETEFFRSLGTDFERGGDLASVHAVEEMAVVDEKSGTGSALCAKLHHHHVEAEYLHLLDAPTAVALHSDIKDRAVVRLPRIQTACGFVEAA